MKKGRICIRNSKMASFFGKVDFTKFFEKLLEFENLFFSKLVNMAVPDTIDDRAINVGKNLGIFKKHENLTLGIQSAKVRNWIIQPFFDEKKNLKLFLFFQSIGIHTINMDAHSLSEGEHKPHLVLGLIWQIIAVSFLNLKNLSQNCKKISIFNTFRDICLVPLLLNKSQDSWHFLVMENLLKIS